MTKHALSFALAVVLGSACSDHKHVAPDAPSASPDAAADAGNGMPVAVAIDASPTPDQISCGSASCDTTMQQHCCASQTMTPTCTTTCNDPVDLACDGPEDCATGQSCCGTPATTGIQTVCAQTCSASQVRLCHDASQCPSDVPVCCGASGSSTGTCSPSGACS
jgi:hypothetical protein